MYSIPACWCVVLLLHGNKLLSTLHQEVSSQLEIHNKFQASLNCITRDPVSLFRKFFVFNVYCKPVMGKWLAVGLGMGLTIHSLPSSQSQTGKSCLQSNYHSIECVPRGDRDHASGESPRGLHTAAFPSPPPFPAQWRWYPPGS